MSLLLHVIRCVLSHGPNARNIRRPASMGMLTACLTCAQLNSWPAGLPIATRPAPCILHCGADQLIESVTNKKVREIFAEDGEDNFREIETQVLAVSTWLHRTVLQKIGTCCGLLLISLSVLGHTWKAGEQWGGGGATSVLAPRFWPCGSYAVHQVSLPHRFAHQELSPFKNCVIATGGGVPTRAENWGHMQVGPQAGRQAGGAEQAAVLC